MPDPAVTNETHLATILPRWDETLPIFGSAALGDGVVLHVTVLDESRPATPPPGVELVSNRNLGLPVATLNHALRPSEGIAAVKPRFLTKVLGDVHEATFVDAECWIDDVGFMGPLPAEGGIELFSALPRDLAAAKPSLRLALRLGFGDPTGDLIRVVNGDAVSEILTAWDEWLLEMYVNDPTANLRTAEVDFLRSLPAANECVNWNRQSVFGLWSDVSDDAGLPPVISAAGLGSHLLERSPADQAAHRHTAGSVAIQSLKRRLRQHSTSDRISEDWPASRTILRAVDPLGLRWPDPGNGSFDEGLVVRDSRGLSRLAQSVYWSRPDLQESFPARRTSAAAFDSWVFSTDLVEAGRRSAPVPQHVSRRVAAKANRIVRKPATLADSRQVPTDLEPGVNLFGFVTAESGLGTAARNTIEALKSLGVPTAIIDTSDYIYSPRRASEWAPIGAPYDVSIFHLNPEELLGYATGSLAYRLGALRNIGFWFWETDVIPDSWMAGIEFIDEIWVASSYVKSALERVTDKPVMVFPLPVAPMPGAGSRSRWGLRADDFVVVSVIDAFSGDRRKNPGLVIEAFRQAFSGVDAGVQLLLKVGNLGRYPDLERELFALADGLPVRIIAEHLSSQDLRDLIATSDALISLHSSEGYGLTLLEAMSHGVAVLATGYGGNTDFMDGENGLLVDYELVPASGERYGGHGRWARPDLDDAARKLLRIWKDPELRSRMSVAGLATAASHSPAAYADGVGDRLKQFFATTSSHRHS